MCGLAVKPGRLGREPVADSCHRSPETARGPQEGKGGGERGSEWAILFLFLQPHNTRQYTRWRGGGDRTFIQYTYSLLFYSIFLCLHNIHILFYSICLYLHNIFYSILFYSICLCLHHTQTSTKSILGSAFQNVDVTLTFWLLKDTLSSVNVKIFWKIR